MARINRYMIPRLAKFVSLGGNITYFAEMPVSPDERIRVYNLWLNDHRYIEPYVRGHRVFDQYPCSINEVLAAGLKGWWEA